MKIRCGSHQQNRSIVRPGLSLMATKVALTAEEFRENSQRSIDLFNTEKLSTDSTRVLKNVYCNSVHFCRCNLHGACGGKAAPPGLHVAVCRCNLHGACGGKDPWGKLGGNGLRLQSARSVWRQRVLPAQARHSRWLQSARSVWRQSSGCRSPPESPRRCNLHGACGGKARLYYISFSPIWLQSARSVWRQSTRETSMEIGGVVAICTERVEAK